MALAAVGVLALGGCDADKGDDVNEPSLDQQLDGNGDLERNEEQAQRESDETLLEHPLVFEHLGMIGYQRADIEPDGAITVTYGMRDPTTAMLDDVDLARVRNTIETAQLKAQPSEIKGETVIDDETIYRFEYGDVRVEAEWTHAPVELRDLGNLLAELTDELAREHLPG